MAKMHGLQPASLLLSYPSAFPALTQHEVFLFKAPNTIEDASEAYVPEPVPVSATLHNIYFIISWEAFLPCSSSNAPTAVHTIIPMQQPSTSQSHKSHKLSTPWCGHAVDDALLAGDAFSRTVLQDYSSVMTVHLNVSIDNTAWFPNPGEAAIADHDQLIDDTRSQGFSVVRPCSVTAPAFALLGTKAHGIGFTLLFPSRLLLHIAWHSKGKARCIRSVGMPMSSYTLTMQVGLP